MKLKALNGQQNNSIKEKRNIFVPFFWFIPEMFTTKIQFAYTNLTHFDYRILRNRWRSCKFLLFFLACVTMPISDAISIEKYTAHGGPVKNLSQSLDGKFLLSSSFDYSVVLWELPEVREITQLMGHDAAVNVAKFSPNGQWIASGGDDNQILLWNVLKILKKKQSAVPIVLKGHHGKIVGLNFSKDSKFIISASWDGTAKIWDVERASNGIDSMLISLEGHDGPVNDATFSNNSKFAYTAGYDGHIRYWRIKDQTYLRSLIKNGWGINVMYLNEEKGLLGFGSTDGAMVIHDFKNDAEILRMGDERVPVLSLEVSLDNTQIGFGNAKGIVKILDLEKMVLLRDFKASNGPIWSMLLLPTQGEMLIASLDDHISKWQVTDFPPEILKSPGPRHRFNPANDISNGEKQFARKCSVCHTLEKDGLRRAGPTLFNLFGRKAGSLEGYTYSEALLKSEIIWSAETIARLFTDGPDIVTPGTKMPIQRMKNKRDRDDLISYLKIATKN